MRAIENTITSARRADRDRALALVDEIKDRVAGGEVLAVAAARVAGKHDLDADHERKLVELALS